MHYGEHPGPMQASSPTDVATPRTRRPSPRRPVRGGAAHNKRKGNGRGTQGPGPSTVGRGGKCFPDSRIVTPTGGPGVFRPLVGVNRLETVEPFLLLLSVTKEEGLPRPSGPKPARHSAFEPPPSFLVLLSLHERGTPPRPSSTNHSAFLAILPPLRG